MADPERGPVGTDILARQLAQAVGVVVANPFMAPEMQNRIGLGQEIPAGMIAAARTMMIYSANEGGK